MQLIEDWGHSGQRM